MSNPDNNEQEELWNGPFGEGFIRNGGSGATLRCEHSHDNN